MLRYITAILSCFAFFLHLPAQSDKPAYKPKADTLTVQSADTGHSVKKAVILSAIVPGTGQIYNRKWWKTPIIYAALSTSIYFALNQNQKFVRYKNAYIQRINGQPDEFSGQPDNWILTNLEIARRNRDLLFIASAGIYVLNIVDAAVDAHLFYFDVSDDLSIHIIPSVSYSLPHVSGLNWQCTFTLNFYRKNKKS